MSEKNPKNPKKTIFQQLWDTTVPDWLKDKVPASKEFITVKPDPFNNPLIGKPIRDTPEGIHPVYDPPYYRRMREGFDQRVVTHRRVLDLVADINHQMRQSLNNFVGQNLTESREQDMRDILKGYENMLRDRLPAAYPQPTIEVTRDPADPATINAQISMPVEIFPGVVRIEQPVGWILTDDKSIRQCFSREVYYEFVEDFSRRRVGKNSVYEGKVDVSTVFLTNEHPPFDGPTDSLMGSGPRGALFETLVRSELDEFDGICIRHHTWKEAAESHQALCIEIEDTYHYRLDILNILRNRSESLEHAAQWAPILEGVLFND